MHDRGGVGEAMCTCGGQGTTLLVSSPLLPLFYSLGNRTQVVWKLLVVWKSRAECILFKCRDRAGGSGVDSRGRIRNKLRMRDFLNIYFNYVYCVYAHKAIFPESGVTGSCEHPNMGATNKLKLSFVRAIHTQPLSHDSSPPEMMC